MTRPSTLASSFTRRREPAAIRGRASRSGVWLLIVSMANVKWRPLAAEELLRSEQSGLASRGDELQRVGEVVRDGHARSPARGQRATIAVRRPRVKDWGWGGGGEGWAAAPLKVKHRYKR